MMTRSNKRKFDEVGKDPVKVYFDPKRIPLELWIYILEYIPGKDLLNLSLVCKLFYETIGCLPEAMDKISLKLNDWTLRILVRYVELILKSSRNYNNITLESIKLISDVTICKRILGKYGANLRTLEFLICEFTEEDFKNILAMVQNNLRTLRFINSKLTESTQHSSKSAVDPIMSRLSKLLIHLSYGYDRNNYIENVFDLLPDTLLEVNCEVESINDFQPRLPRFLHRQKNLKHLCLKSLRNTECLKEIDNHLIKLSKLEIGLLDDENSNHENFGEFLQSHAESLKELKLENVSLNSLNAAFKNMPNLKLLKLADCMLDPETELDEVEPNFNCPNLKTITINSYDYSSLDKFVSRFPNIEEIVSEDFCELKLIEKIVKNHPNIKTLVINELDDDSFKSLSFKNITKLQIHKIYDYAFYECYADTEPFEINMEHSIFALENLEILKLGSLVLATMTSLMFILFNSKKLQHLEIDNGSRLSDFLLCKHLDFFKNLRFLKILNLPEQVKNFIDNLLKFPDLKHTLSNRSVPMYEFSV